MFLNTQNERHAEIMRLTIKRYSSIVGIYILLLLSLSYICWPQDSSSVETDAALDNQTSLASSNIPNNPKQGTLPHDDEIENHLLLVVAVMVTFALFLMKSMLAEIQYCRSYRKKYASAVAICCY